VRLSRAVGGMRLRRVHVVAWERGREYVVYVRVRREGGRLGKMRELRYYVFVRNLEDLEWIVVLR
jgi:hypothetical protein